MQPICTDVLKTSKILYRTRRSWIDLEERSSVKWGHNPSSLLLSSYYSFPLIIPHSFYFSCLSSRPHFSRPFLFPILLGSLFLSIQPPPPTKKRKEKSTSWQVKKKWFVSHQNKNQIFEKKLYTCDKKCNTILILADNIEINCLKRPR